MASSNFGRGQITSRSKKDLKVILDAISGYMGKLTIKHVNQHLCVIIYAIQSGGTIGEALRPKRAEKVPLTRREHVNHVTEGH